MAASSVAHRRASGVIVGVDTHKDLHVARAKDELGRGLGDITIPASAKGYRALLSWSRDLGEVRAFGVEGTACYGVGLARNLRAHGQVVIEVIRPNRQARRLRGKSDPADADVTVPVDQNRDRAVHVVAVRVVLGRLGRVDGIVSERDAKLPPNQPTRQINLSPAAGSAVPIRHNREPVWLRLGEEELRPR